MVTKEDGPHKGQHYKTAAMIGGVPVYFAGQASIEEEEKRDQREHPTGRKKPEELLMSPEVAAPSTGLAAGRNHRGRSGAGLHHMKADAAAQFTPDEMDGVRTGANNGAPKNVHHVKLAPKS
jgi:hypothetical protein